MNKIEEKLFNISKRITLSPSARLRIRTNLLNIINAGQKPTVISWAGLRWIKAVPVLASTLVIAVVGGGIAFAAENSLPGSPLYGIKINVTEEIREAFTLSDKAAAKLAVERASRRLKEAETLARRGELSKNVQQNLKDQFTEHTQDAQQKIKVVGEKTSSTAAVEVSSQLETLLSAHTAILKGIAEASETNVREVVSSLVEAVETESKEAIQARAAAEADVKEGGDKGNIEKLALEAQELAEGSLNKSRELFSTEEAGLTNAESDALLLHMESAANLYAQGKERLSAKAWGEAFTNFQRSAGASEEVELLIKSKKIFGVTFSVEDETTTAITVPSATSSATSTIPDAQEEPIEGGIVPPGTVCIQVITLARHPDTGAVKEFSTPCDVPPHWVILSPEVATSTQSDSDQD